ncbi:MAG: DNA polymerase III subunit alpha [Deltaproteobacteria bacterium]|nr:DNA polymerase III subunit alpha [Deltaproteobacteria bacterium]
MSNFVHLHLHTQYSVLDGAIKISNLVKKLKEDQHHAVAITDHGVMHGVIEFYQAMRAENIKPIIGCEVYITPGSRFDRTFKGHGGAPTHHLTLLAQNQIGYKNLCKLVGLSYLEGFYFKPRIDHELLKQCNEGLICLSGCLACEISSYAEVEDIEGGRKLMNYYLDCFGDRFYLELQPHEMKEQKNLNHFSMQLAKEFNISLVATNDCHYLSADDKYAQEVLMCVSTGKIITDTNRLQHLDCNLHVKTETEMFQEFAGIEEAVRNSVKIAERCNLEFDFSTYRMPKYSPPEGIAIDDFFANAAREGLDARIKQYEQRKHPLSEQLQKDYHARLEEEIALIKQMGFAGYFLVVSDFIRWAKSNDVPVGPGRGSAAGSLVAYAMFITEIDPLPYKLLFERFLNPDRISLPDIDVDFCINGRDKVIDYVCNKYGKDKVAQICTFGTLKAKAVIKDVGRVLGLSYAETDRIAKLIPAPRQGFDFSLSESIKMEKRLAEYAEGEGKDLIELGLKLEGLSRHTSTHAAGIVIADEPVIEVLPLMVDKDNQIVTQLSMSYVEKIGLVKFDFLGLKTLTVLNLAVKMIAAGTDKIIDLNNLPLDDQKTFRLISNGDTIGVFQLESTGITEMVSRLKPNCFEDIVAILALYRPGPLDAGMVDHYINRKHKREPLRYPHPILEPILRDTYGIILYQEQIMQIARDMGGYSLGEADMLRRAMGKKKPEEMKKHRDIFVKGAINRGVPEPVATEVFDQMETFARYGFNKSHSVAYAMISYQTAYLKTHYAPYFMAALMTHEMTDTDKTLKNINECRKLQIKIIPPNVNTESAQFGVEKGRITFGLAAIKNVGEKAVDRIIEKRNLSGKFKGLYDFCRRVDGNLLNRRLLENFIKAGAFDWSNLSRAELIKRIDDAIYYAQRDRKAQSSSQMGLFGDLNKIDDQDNNSANMEAEWPTNIRLAYEREALGFYLSGHPLEKFKKDLERVGALSVSALERYNDDAIVTVAGVISLLKEKNTKKGERYATFTLEDLGGIIEVIVWPDVYRKVQEMLTSQDPVVITAKMDVTEERSQLIAQDIQLATAVRDRHATEAIIRVDYDQCTSDKLDKLKEILAMHKGELPVKVVCFKPAHSETVISLAEKYKVEPSELLCNKVETLFGQPVVSFK